LILVAVSLVLIVIGLDRSFFIIGYRASVPEFREAARVGSLFILGGSAASLAAAVWSYLRGHPYWVTVCVAAPALVVGGIALMGPQSLLRHIGAVVALPAAVAGIIGGLLDRGHWAVR
jgi:hypothetical protein